MNRSVVSLDMSVVRVIVEVKPGIEELSVEYFHLGSKVIPVYR